ncbi:24196_t:CDS:2, partial [Dentiscutata erythropus]
QRFSYNTFKSLTQDSLENSTIQLDPSTVYSLNELMKYDEPMEYYEESNEYSFEDDISYYNEPAIYSSKELDEDKDSCEFTSETSSINSYDELSSNSLSENEFFDDIADKALDSDKLSQNIDDFLPYFENTTTALMFSTNAYDKLVEILHHSQFNINHVVKNIWFFRRWRQRLPLMPIYSRPISISTMKTS